MSGVAFIHSDLDDYGLRPAEFRIYCHLSRRAGENSECYPGIDSMAETCRLSKPTVIAAVRTLEGLGMLSVERREGVGSRYRLTPKSQWLSVVENLTSKKEVTVSTSKKEVTDQSKAGNATSKKEVTKGTPMKVIQEGTPSLASPRKRDLILDCLAGLDGSDPLKCTSIVFSGAAKARKVIQEVTSELTVEEIARRAANYHLHMPTCVCTPHALAKHWAKCDAPPPPKAKTIHVPESNQVQETIPIRIISI